MPPDPPHTTINLTQCQGNLHPEAVHGIHLFNHQDFFEAHEALEAAWKDEKGPIRDLYRGILQVAVGYYHLKRGNITGTRKMFHRCRQWLRLFPGQCRGVDVARLIWDYQSVEARLDRLASESPTTLESLIFPPVVLINEAPHGTYSPTGK
jgi:predicted metal-dependent hydrolase